MNTTSDSLHFTDFHFFVVSIHDKSVYLTTDIFREIEDHIIPIFKEKF